jgi:hypothetical protein
MYYGYERMVMRHLNIGDRSGGLVYQRCREFPAPNPDESQQGA